MRYLLIGQEAHTLPYAIEITEETLEQALLSTADIEEGRNLYQAMFIVDLETGEAKRTVRDKKGAWTVSDTAYTQNLGIATPDEYFQEPETMEMDP